MSINRSVSLCGAFVAIAALGGCAGHGGESGDVRLGADLSGAQEVPPVTTPASANARVWVDPAENVATWVVDYEGLSSPLTAAHFHGPAAPGTNAGVQIPIVTKGPANSPLTGAVTLTDAQEADLLAGRYYINLHTQNHPSGEIRGQVVAGQAMRMSMGMPARSGQPMPMQPGRPMPMTPAR